MKNGTTDETDYNYMNEVGKFSECQTSYIERLDN